MTGIGLLTGVRLGCDRELTNGVLGFFLGFFLVFVREIDSGVD